jgi:YebC/PmpR family DNA-binding regulatory protein
MSGHSKWSTIKRKKAAADAKRSNAFAKLLRAVEVAAKEGGGSIDGNPTLASAVDKARDASVPWDNIERAIKRGTGELGGGARYEEVTYEGYGPGGVALIVEALTDNRNRTSQDVRYAFTRNGGSLGDPGSTAWMFARKGVVQIEKSPAIDEEKLLEMALDAGAEDVADDGSTWEITTDPTALRRVREVIEAAGIPVLSAELTMVPQTQVPVDGAQARQVLALLDALEELDDVQNVYANFDIPDEVLAEVG